MTCNFCGSFLEDNEVECPFCGHKTGLEDNSPVIEPEIEDLEPETVTEVKGDSSKPKITLPKVNFNRKKAADTAERPAAKEPRQNPMRNVTSAVSSGKFNPTLIALIGFAACALLIIISLISIGSVKRSLEESNQALLSQIYQLQNADQKINDRLDELGGTVSSVSSTINEQATSRNINITKEPTSTATYLDRGSAEDVSQNAPIFTCTATGVNLKFTWQRYDDASGSWVNLVFDNDSNNDTYGLHFYTDAQKGYAELSAHGVKAAAFGSYRCQIADDFGVKNTETVVLSERQKEA